MNRAALDRFVGGFFFAAFIASHFLFGITVAVRVLGVACIVTGVVWVVKKTIPVGIEGREPSFFLGGIGAYLLGMAMLGLSVALILYAKGAACILGWAAAAQCV